MHSIRSAARKQAWYHNNDPENRTYNFFGRPNRNSRRRPRENEDGLVQTQTDDFPSSKEIGDDGNIPGPQKSWTSPTSGPSNSQPHHHASLNGIDEKEKDSSTSDDTQVVSTKSRDGNDTGARRRNKFHIPFLGKKNKDNELEKTTSRQSKKPKGSGQKLTIGAQLKTIFMSWINILLVFIPVGLAFEYANLNGPATFVLNFLAIVPLASMLSFATEELSYYVGETFGGLLNASFGNATELIVSIIALTQGKIVIVQTSLIGSILSNLLLVLGMCFFFGGLNRLEQFFNITVAQTAASLLALAIGALVTPTAFRIFSPDDQGVTPLSRAAAVLLLLTYICYLFFQLRTHIDMYNEPSKKTEKQANVFKGKKHESDMSKGIATIGAQSAATTTGGVVNRDSMMQDRPQQEQRDDDDSSESDDGENEPQLSKWVALAVLAASTALIAVTSDGMVSAIDAITQPAGPLSEEFVGLILIPIVGNAAEHATAVTVAIKDKMDLAIGVAVGSSLQIALLVIPLMVIISWCGLGQSVIVNGGPAVLDLNFDGFQIVVVFLAVILVNYVIQDGRSHWLEGVMLFVTYVIFAVAAWYYPQTQVQQ